MEIKWSSYALDDLEGTLYDIEERFNFKCARRFRAEIIALARRLANFPDLGKREPLLAHLLDGNIRSIPVDKLNKLIYIETYDDRLYILALWNTRRNPDTLIAETSGRTRR